MKNAGLVATLNNLIQICKDGEQGFLACAGDIPEQRFKLAFTQRAADCAAAARELQALVRAYGGKPETGGSLGGALHRRWVDVKAAILRHDDLAILEEGARGEDVALHHYRAALQTGLRPEARSVVERQYQGVMRNHDLVMNMHDNVHVPSC